jgi:hypothetical protein
MRTDTVGGVGNAANLLYYDTVEIRIPFQTGLLSFAAVVGFTQGMEAQGIGLLGQAGFFEKFRVQFDHKARLFYIEA